MVDLAQGHIAALQQMLVGDGNSRPQTDDARPSSSSPSSNRYRVYNLGTGNGQSVLEVVAAMNRAIGRELPLQFADRRPGDVPILVADVTLATSELG